MVEIEFFSDAQTWNQSWLLNTVEIDSSTETFSGTVTAENLEWVDPKTVRCLLTVESKLPTSIEGHPAVITSNTTLYPDIKRLSPSAGTSWPLPDHSELLVGFIQDDLKQPIALGSLYNNDKTDPVCNINSSEHILRSNAHTALIMDDENPKINFNYQKNNIILSQDLAINNLTANIIVNARENIIYHSQHDTHEISENNYNRMAQKNFSVNTQIGNMNYQAGNNLTLQAEDNLNISSPHTIALQAEASINLSTDLSLITSQNITLESSGIINMASDKDILIIGEENIRMCVGSSVIEITKEGIINFNAASITISGQPILSVKPTSPM